MSTTRLSVSGDEITILVPADIRAQLDLQDGARVSVGVDNGRLTIKPMPRYSLEKMVAQCGPDIERTAEDREWLDAKPMGREIW